jgi:hypothetical protein
MIDHSDHRAAAGDVPIVGRPRGEGWRSLQSDGVLWEGQVFIVGEGADIPARMIVTTSRVAFASGGEVVLEIPRLWLRPAPELLRDGSVAIHILEPGSPYGAPPETLDLAMRDGSDAASHLVAMLSGTAGRRSLPDLDLLAPRTRPVFPESERRAAAPSESSRAPRHAAPLPRWEEDPPTRPAHPQTMPPSTPPSAPRPAPAPSPAAMVVAAEEGKPIRRPAAPPTASGPARNWNLPMQEYVVPRSQRRARWGWTVKLGGLVGLLALAAALGSGRIGTPLDGLDLSASAPTPFPTASTSVTTAEGPAGIASEPGAEPSGIGGATSASLLATEPGNAPLAAPPLQVEEGSTETWTEPTAAAPAPALLAPLPVSTMPAASMLAGVGGELPSVDSIAGEVAAALPQTPEPAVTPPPAPTQPPPPEPTATPMPEPTQAPAPTEVPAAAPTEAPPPPPTSVPEPTATAIPEPTATAIPEQAAEPEPAPTEISAAQEAPAGDPAAAAPAAPSLAWNLRMATGGQSLPEFGLPPSTAGNWIVLVVDLTNTGDAATEVPMSQFRLATSAGDAAIDASTDLAAMIAGITPQWTASDVISLQPGEATRALLLFQVDPAAAGMTLTGNGFDQSIGDALGAGVTLNMLPAPSAP